MDVKLELSIMNATTLTCYKTLYMAKCRTSTCGMLKIKISDIKFQQISESKACLDLQAVNRKPVSGMFSSFHVEFHTQYTVWMRADLSKWVCRQFWFSQVKKNTKPHQHQRYRTARSKVVYTIGQAKQQQQQQNSTYAYPYNPTSNWCVLNPLTPHSTPATCCLRFFQV